MGDQLTVWSVFAQKMFGVELRPQAMETSRVPTPWCALGPEVYSLSLFLFKILKFIFKKLEYNCFTLLC